MSTIPQKHEVSKLLAMADNVVVRNQVYGQVRRTGQAEREYGRLTKSISELAKSAEKCRADGKAGQP